MAQVVKLEPGDVLVLANVGADAAEDLPALELLKARLSLEQIVIFAGDVDISKLPADAS